MKRTRQLAALCCTALCGFVVAAPAAAQGPPHEEAGMQDQNMSHMEMHPMNMDPASMFLMGESSGTSFQPSSWPMPMVMTGIGGWHLMWMGQAFLADTQQSGPRGGDKFYSTNWGMLGAVHRLGGGAIMLRSMISLEPATITERKYPLLFQTGETAFGKPIVDGQHPHDLFMEVSVQYAHSLGENATWNIYYAPVGEPALGPIPYPHRASAMEFPQATLGHHWEDSTHIADNVLTAGLNYKKVRLEASGFYGREPNENRWNFDYGPMDSWAARLSFYPTKNWSAQVSSGVLHSPEAAHPGDVTRTTASVEYVAPRPAKNSWATSLIWGQDYKRDERRTVNAVLAETVYPLGRSNFITGRYEWSQRDELFENSPAAAGHLFLSTGGEAFNVNAYTVGYTRDVNLIPDLQSGLGANVSTYAIDDALKPYYGSHPWGVNVFLRFRLKASEKSSHD